ncbi:class I tRNA ligase family protein [Candidatus Gottesmanbacteria bacterium]|nr:class I tRNA ligase family protein [Candidatus Gottesmanbacteria bacterium]
MGPFDKGGDFRDTAMEGMSRWVNRVWRLSLNSLSHLSTLSTLGNLEIKRALQKLVKKVTEDIEKRRYNTAIAAMMEFTNEVSHLRGGGKGHLGGVSGVLGKEELATFIKLLAPFAPHLTEELYQRIMNYDLRITNQNQENRKSYFVNRNSIHVQPWPEYDPSEMSEEFVQMVVQINGKLRDKLNVSVQQSKDHSAIEELARNRERVKKFLEGKKVVKSVFVPGRLINFVL